MKTKVNVVKRCSIGPLSKIAMEIHVNKMGESKKFRWNLEIGSLIHIFKSDPF